jgi:hypothetical protein
MGPEEFYREGLESPMPDRNKIRPSAPTQDYRRDSLDARISIHLLAAFGLKSEYLASDRLNHIGAHMRASS